MRVEKMMSDVTKRIIPDIESFGQAGKIVSDAEVAYHRAVEENYLMVGC